MRFACYCLVSTWFPEERLSLLQVDLKPASDVLAGAMARAASQSTIHPLDTLKVHTCALAALVPLLLICTLCPFASRRAQWFASYRTNARFPSACCAWRHCDADA